MLRRYRRSIGQGTVTKKVHPQRRRPLHVLMFAIIALLFAVSLAAYKFGIGRTGPTRATPPPASRSAK